MGGGASPFFGGEGGSEGAEFWGVLGLFALSTGWGGPATTVHTRSLTSRGEQEGVGSVGWEDVFGEGGLEGIWL